MGLRWGHPPGTGAPMHYSPPQITQADLSMTPQWAESPATRAAITRLLRKAAGREIRTALCGRGRGWCSQDVTAPGGVPEASR